MFLVYKPLGQPEQRWHFLPGRMHSGEMILIEKVSDLRYGNEFKQELMMGGTTARKALLWVMLRRQHPTIRFADVEFYDDELQLIQDKDEIAAELEAMESEERPEAMSEAQWMAGLMLLRRQLAEAPDAPGKAPADTPAVPEPTAAAAPPPPTSNTTAYPSGDPSTMPVPYPLMAYPSSPYPVAPVLAPLATDVQAGASMHPVDPGH